MRHDTDAVTPYRDPGDLALGGFVSRDAFRFVRDYPHPQARVWAALTEPEQLGAWFWPCLSFEPRLGGVGVFNPGKEMALRITEFDPPRRLSLAGRICFTLEAQGDGCRLTLDLTRPDDGWSPMALAGFHGWLGRLARLMAGRPQDETEEWALHIWNSVIDHCETEVRRFVADGAAPVWRVHFAANDAALAPEAAAQLTRLADLLIERRLAVTIDGFGDDPCGPQESLTLCAERVDAVSAFLQGRGLLRERINVGFVLGNYHYLVERDDEAGRAYNRRLELRPVY